MPVHTKSLHESGSPQLISCRIQLLAYNSPCFGERVQYCNTAHRARLLLEKSMLPRIPKLPPHASPAEKTRSQWTGEFPNHWDEDSWLPRAVAKLRHILSSEIALGL